METARPAPAVEEAKPALPLPAQPTQVTVPPPVDCNVIKAVVRDFRGADEAGGHPDFQRYKGEGVTAGLVATGLGADQKPVYADGPGVPKPHGPQITNQVSFDAWYRDVPGVNQRFVVELPLTAGVYQSDAFFPIDGRGFGNRIEPPHNFSFTTEIHTEFFYEKEKNLVFAFDGDDDLWIFVNGRLALDLGGLHPAAKQTIDFNAQAAALGLVDGQIYPMAIFHAERHTVFSRFHVQTNIACLRSTLE